jgi:hypothetical protein
MASEGGKTAAATVKLDVDLDTTADPPVQISNRDKKVPSGDNIKWDKAPGAPNFSFSDFQPQSTPFDSVSVQSNKVECDFSPPSTDPSDTEYPYTITVTYNDEEYTSDKSTVTQPTGGRAVIRN